LPPNLVGQNNGWEILEENSYDRAVAQCANHQFFDEALAPIIYALHRNPLGFKNVSGFANIRLAKTKLRLKGPEIIPSYLLWFRTDIAERRVYKLWVELASPEDMGIGKSLWDEEDDISF
jgi:hypothetical protein